MRPWRRIIVDTFRLLACLPRGKPKYGRCELCGQPSTATLVRPVKVGEEWWCRHIDLCAGCLKEDVA